MKKGFTPHHFLNNISEREQEVKDGTKPKRFGVVCIKSGGGFTLIEVIVAISVMLIGIVGLYSLIPKVVSITGANNNKFIASQLAREGIEIARNIRDTNWLEGESWQEGLDIGDWRVQYDKESLLTFSDEPLKIDGNGFFNYDSGEPAKFKRKLSLSYPEADVLNIKVQVTWSGDGSPFEMEENLYDWR